MTSEETLEDASYKVFWRNIVVEYWYFVVLFGLITIGAIIGAILTLNWYIDTSPIGGQGTWTFDQFSMGSAIEWVIFLILWTLIIVGLPVLIVGGILVAIIWYEIFSLEQREEIKSQIQRDEERKKRLGRTSEGSGAFGFFMFIGMCIYIALDGNWMTEFGNLSFSYFINAWIAVFLWAVVICGIAVVFGLLWFINKYESVDEEK
jgi:hypothetical protein